MTAQTPPSCHRKHTYGCTHDYDAHTNGLCIVWICKMHIIFRKHSYQFNFNGFCQLLYSLVFRVNNYRLEDERNTSVVN